MFFIYCITNKLSGKSYIGQTRQKLARRWGLHKSRMRKNYSFHLYNAMRKYGEDSFDVMEIASAETQDAASTLETLWIICLQTTNPQFGYNNTFGGEGFGIKTPEAIEKHRQKLLGKKATEAAKARMSESLRKAWREGRHKGNGGNFSAETREKMSLSRRGGKHPAYRHDIKNEDLIAFRKLGNTLGQTASHFGVSRSLVERRFKKAGFFFTLVFRHSEEAKIKIAFASRLHAARRKAKQIDASRQ